MSGSGKPLFWLGGAVKSPPFTLEARIEAGFLLRLVQEGENLGMPHSRPMPSVGPRCHELRITDASARWRIIYRVDEDALLVVEVFGKKTRETPKNVIMTCRARLRRYDDE